MVVKAAYVDALRKRRTSAAEGATSNRILGYSKALILAMNL